MTDEKWMRDEVARIAPDMCPLCWRDDGVKHTEFKFFVTLSRYADGRKLILKPEFLETRLECTRCGEDVAVKKV
jgi:hypothetical protein